MRNKFYASPRLHGNVYGINATFKPCKVKICILRMIGKKLYQIDLETGGFKNLICSYVLKGKKVSLIESGPTSSVPKLIEGLKELKVSFEDVEYVGVTHVHLDHGGGAGTLLKVTSKRKSTRASKRHAASG